MKKVLCTLLCAALLLSGCGAAKTSENEMADSYRAETAAAMDAGGAMASSDTGGRMPENRKFIITMNVSAETEDLDTAMEELTAALSDCGGYVEDQSVYNGSAYSGRRYRSADLTARIPADKLEAFTQQVGQLSNVVSSSRNTEDVTLQYVDTESRIAVLKAEQTRLMELLSQAENMSDLLEIEARLTDIRADLESYTSRLRVLENQIDYATMYLSLTEVKEYTPVEEKTRLQQIGEGFVRSLRDLGAGILDFATAVLIDLPYIALTALVVLAVWKLGKRLQKKRKAKVAPPKEKQE